jgi:hypothetical protein
MYNVKAIFQKAPTAIAAVLVAGLNLAMSFGLDLSGDQVGLINLFAIGVLGLFVFNSVTPTANPTLAEGTEVSVQNSEDKVIIQKSPPGPEGIEGE